MADARPALVRDTHQFLKSLPHVVRFGSVWGSTPSLLKRSGLLSPPAPNGNRQRTFYLVVTFAGHKPCM
ncbi:hypothetical protein [Amantichitinum ursilacus]|uniref:Uncharacterized protein n=1 Tax=Amantichitinum ursilacus TaxID=857265 RepID=A0A0N0GL04_9NEIS|nr:hypothetical protein [Amantichitinum ursilacus]KPC49397.1 hypothetical protein WG78_20920 [Amantichitinum ursilacus]